MVSKPLVEGKLNAAALSGLLKKVEANRGAAYLLVSDGLSEKCLYFSVGAVRLSSTGRRRARTLSDAISAHPRAGPGALAEARALVKSDEMPIEDALGAVGLGDVVRECSSAIVRDELLDLVVWDGATYEWCEANPPPKIFDPSLEAVKLSMGFAKLLKETDEVIARWQKAAQKLGQARGRIQRGSAPPVERAGLAADTIMAAVGPQGATFDEVFLACRRAGIDVGAAIPALEALLDVKALEIPRSQPKRTTEEENAVARREIDEIEAALANMINELVARQRLAARYQAVGNDKRAAMELKVVGDELVKRSRAEEAVDVFRQVLGMAPTDFGTREKLVGLFEKLKRIPDAVREGVVLAREFGRFGLFNRAKEVFRHLITLAPKEVPLRRELIELMVKLREDQQAVVEYEGLAELLEERNDEQQLLAVYQQISRLDPTHKTAAEKLRQVARKAGSYVAHFVAVASGFLVIAAVTILVLSQFRTLRDFQAARDTALSLAAASDFDGARATIDDFVHRHESQADRVARLRGEIDEEEHDTRAALSRDAFAAAQRLEQQKRGKEALAAYSELYYSPMAHGTEWEAKASDRAHALERAAAEADRLALKVRQSTQDNEGKVAFDAARDLVRRLAWTSAAEQCEVPLKIVTTPPGAAISINSRPQAARTPQTLLVRANDPMLVQLSLLGFATDTRTIDLRDEAPIAWPLDVTLQRALRWRAAVLGPIESPPLVGADGVFVCGRDERVWSFGSDGRARWIKSLGIFADAQGAVMRAGSRIIVADRSGQATAVEAGSGTVLWRLHMSGPSSGVVAPSSDLAVVLEGGTALVGIEAVSGAQRWRTPLLGSLAASPSVDDSGMRILLATTDATVFVIDALSGRELTRLSCGSRPVAPPAASGGLIAVATEDGLLRALTISDGHEMWHHALPAGASAAPTFGGSLVFAPSGDKLVALSVVDGSERWTTDLHARVSAPVASRAGRLYAGTSAGTIHALSSETGAQRWTFHTEGEILAAPIAAADTVYAASADFHIYAIAD